MTTKGTCLITGASRGIGRATALLAAQQGYDIAINFVSDEAAALSVKRDCETHGVQALAVQADVALESEVDALFAACDDALSPLAVLVNNAGVIDGAGPVAELNLLAFERTFAVNVRGSFLCARAAIQRLSTRHGGPGGSIVNLSSIAARLGSPGEYVHYAASKAAIDTFTIGLAKEVGAEGIRVNAVRAGTTDTEIHARSGNPDRPAMVARQSPLGRVASPEDIAEAILWLASDKASFVTGTLLDVDGGL